MIRYILFGESHGPGIGVVVTGLPAGLAVDMEAVALEMRRRAPGNSPLATSRREADAVRIVSGLFNGTTTGSPLCALIDNTDTRSGDYSLIPRPGHADFAAQARYRGFQDYRGGGHFSGRLTAPLVFAGSLVKQILAGRGIEIFAHIRNIGPVADAVPDPVNPDLAALRALAGKELAVLDNGQGERMREAVLTARERLDSIGGSIRCLICGLPAGHGGPDLDDTLEGILGRHLFSIPAVKGVEFGSGFSLTRMYGSEANDALIPDADLGVRTRTNHNGGINGGISNGMPLVFSVAFKPTPSIGLPQDSVDPATGEAVRLELRGRHDPCIVPRAVPVVEAAAALALGEALGV